MFTSVNGGRDGVRNLLLFRTDAVPTLDMSTTISEAILTQNAGIDVNKCVALLG